jgi:hypothetical protein
MLRPVIATALALCLLGSTSAQAWSVKNMTLSLDPPFRYELPLRGHLELTEVDLKVPILLAGGYFCYRVKVCVDWVGKFKP